MLHVSNITTRRALLQMLCTALCLLCATALTAKEFNKKFPSAVERFTNLSLRRIPGESTWFFRLNDQTKGATMPLAYDSYIGEFGVTIGTKHIKLELVNLEEPYRGQGIPWILLSIAVHLLPECMEIKLNATQWPDENPPHIIYAKKQFQPDNSTIPIPTEFGTHNPTQLFEWLRMFDYSRNFTKLEGFEETPEMRRLRTGKDTWPSLNMTCFTGRSIPQWALDAGVDTTTPSWLTRNLGKLSMIDRQTRSTCFGFRYWNPTPTPPATHGSAPGILCSEKEYTFKAYPRDPIMRAKFRQDAAEVAQLAKQHTAAPPSVASAAS